jgi:hypothetical protein
MKKNLLTSIAKNRKALLIIGAVVAVLIIVLSVFFGLYFVKQNTNASILKEELKKVVSVMQDEKNKTGGYPATIDGLMPITDEVKLTGGGSFDGVSYCVAATSVSDDSIVFHVDSTKSANDILNGDCKSGSGVSVSAAPSGMAVAFASFDTMKLTWNKTYYASSYTLQCSVSKEFDNPITVDSAINEGVCTGLKPATRYYYRVKATSSAGASDWSIVSNYKTNSK